MHIELSITEDGKTEILIIGEKKNSVIYANPDCVIYIGDDKVVIEE